MSGLNRGPIPGASWGVSFVNTTDKAATKATTKDSIFSGEVDQMLP